MDLCDSSTDGFMDTTALTKTIAFSFKGINFDEKILHKEVFFKNDSNRILVTLIS